jgi:hypothetical protein
MERTLQTNTREYKNLKAVASMLEALSPNGYKYEVKDVYLDFGQDWMWTTIIRNNTQILCPRDWKMIVMATTPQELAEVVEVIRSDEYFRDK